MSMSREERINTEESTLLEPYVRKGMLTKTDEHSYRCRCGREFHAYHALRMEASCICEVLENYLSTFQD